jgi:hypothetical protein
MFCRECGTKTNKQGEDFLCYKYQCPNPQCRKTYSEKKEWVNNAGLVGTGLSAAGFIWKVANGDYVDAAIQVANKVTGNDDITNV